MRFHGTFQMDLYMQSVGLGSNLILNFPPGPSGQIEPAFVEVAKEFGQEVASLWASPVSVVHGAHGRAVVLSLPKNHSITRVVLREDMSAGQRIAGFIIEGCIQPKRQDWHSCIFQDPIVSHKCMSKMAVKTSKDTHKTAAELGTP